jgi:SAM-dependent methyltransferase
VSESEGQRQPHAVLDLHSRRFKAQKIERLLDLDARPGPLRLLEVGTGSGGIAHYFGTHPSRRFRVSALDVVDNRQAVEGYEYVNGHDTQLPLPDASFDVVLSNHVIEHVGPPEEQLQHLQELRRVLRRDGIGYVAVPNRWMLVEPHYRLAFLSWWPRSWRTPYLRMMGRGKEYDCLPLSAPEARGLLRGAGFTFEQQCGRALRITFELESPGSLLWRGLLRFVPDWAWALAAPIFPTLIYVVRPLPAPSSEQGTPGGGPAL